MSMISHQYSGTGTALSCFHMELLPSRFQTEFAMKRRTFFAAAASAASLHAADPWSQLPAILRRIQPPRFADRDFDVSRFGARPDAKSDCTGAFSKAIAACVQAGGGRVVVPAGEY